MNFIESLEAVSRAMHQAKDVDDIIDHVLETVMSIFGCDRAWLFHPCDPNAATFKVLAEKNNPAYPGAFSSGQELPINAEASETIRKSLDADSPVIFGPAAENKIDDVAARFSVQSQMLMAIHPKTGKPWMFGMHQCAYARDWTQDEQQLFKEISHRVVESLNNLILLRDLKSSEQKYRRFFTTVRNGWAYHRTITNADSVPVDYVFLEVNKAFEKLTGLKRADIVGRPATQVLAHDRETLSDWIDKFGRVSLNGASMTFEGYLASTGKWYSVSASSPEPGHFITVFENISERKAAEEALRESEERYALALRAADVGTWDWNVVTGGLKWSEQIEPMFGFAKGQFGGTYEDFLDCVHPEDRQLVADAVNEALYHDKTYDLEFRIIWTDKSVHWVEAKGEVLRNKSAGPVRMLGVVQDISESKESFERFRTVLDSLDSVVYVADMETYELLFVNKYARDIWGDISGQICWQTLQKGQDGPCAFCTNDLLIDAHSNPTGPYIWEFRNTMDGQWYECRDQAIRWLDGRIVRMEIASNITQRKAAEEQKVELEEKLRQALKMEAIGTLAGGIAHDFNNILSAILGYAELAKESSYQFPAISETLDEVIKAAHRAEELVRQILAFSRRADAQRIAIRPASIIREAVKMLRPSLPATIEIDLNIDPKAGPVLADPTQIHQILMNLGTNAFHAMERTGGRLVISLKETILNAAELGEEPNVGTGNFVQLSVCDSGPGIAPAIREKVFDPYFTTKDAGKGTGMGLAVVHGIVKSYGGLISIECEPGAGTAVKVFLPVVEAESDPHEDVVTRIPGGDEHILVVDDERALTHLNKIMLEELGYHVKTSTNGQEALQLFRRHPEQFDLVITDQTMPRMTGADLATQILQIRPEIPIILCTGYSSIISEEEARAIGIRSFVEKPLGRKDIARLIRRVLDDPARD